MAPKMNKISECSEPSATVYTKSEMSGGFGSPSLGSAFKAMKSSAEHRNIYLKRSSSDMQMGDPSSFPRNNGILDRSID